MYRKEDPSSASILKYLGDIYSDIGYYKEALKKHEKSLKLMKNTHG